MNLHVLLRPSGRFVLSIVVASAAAHVSAAPTLAPDQPVAVRILYDGSGSMYPGYRPPGTPGRRTKADLGVPYFHETPRFRDWLADLVSAQTLLGAGSVGMSTFTSNGLFSPDDIREVHPAVPVGDFDVDRAIRNFPPTAGQTTYLTETIDQFARGFTGILWLVTDNIVETTAGQADAEVERFFRKLNDDPRFRSVHLFKYPFRDERTGSESALAAYAIIVSPTEIPAAALAHYDRILRSSMRTANGRRGPLFPGQEHLKLKDLRIDPLELRAVPTLTLLLDGRDRGLFKEGQRIQLGLTGDIRSNLTQHSVTDGRYALEVSSPFRAEEWARRDLDAQPLPATAFESATASIDRPIPPNGSRQVRAELHSTQPVSFSPKSLGAWLRLAWNGATVKYTGTVQMSFTDVNVRLERSRMAGIFGIDRASAIFDFQDVRTIDQITPSRAQVSFALKTGASRTALFLIALAIAATVAGLGIFVLTRPEWYRVTISGIPERLVPLHRLGTFSVQHDGQVLGHLSRDLLGAYRFQPNTSTAAFQIKASPTPDAWDIRFRNGHGCQLSILPRGGKRAAAPPAAARPPAVRPSASPSPRSMPRIDRP